MRAAFFVRAFHYSHAQIFRYVSNICRRNQPQSAQLLVKWLSYIQSFPFGLVFAIFLLIIMNNNNTNYFECGTKSFLKNHMQFIWQLNGKYCRNIQQLKGQQLICIQIDIIRGHSSNNHTLLINPATIFRINTTDTILNRLFQSAAERREAQLNLSNIQLSKIQTDYFNRFD